MPGSRGPGGLGDFAPKSANPLETYWDIYRQGVGLSKRKLTVDPKWVPCDVGARVPQGPNHDLVAAIIRAQQDMLECHSIPRYWQLLADFFMKLQDGTFMVKNPNWHEAPVTGIPKDIRNDDPVSVAATTPTTVVSFRVPDRHVATVTGFGNGMCTFNDWNRVLWTAQVNKKPIVGYQDFRLAIGEYDRPQTLPMPFILKYNDLYEVTARLSAAGAAADVFVRNPAFTFPVRSVVQDGTYKAWNTPV